MGAKLGQFLRVLGASLSPQAFAVQQNQYAAEQADKRQIESENRAQDRTIETLDLKQGLATLGILGAAYDKETDPAKKSEIIKQVKTVTTGLSGGNPKIESAAKNAFAGARFKARETQKGKEFPALDENKNPVMAIVNEKGQIVDSTTFEHKPLWTKAPTKAETGGPGAFTKKTDSEIQDQQLKIIQGKDRVKAIRSGYKPEFTEIGTKASVKFTAFTEKLGITPSKASKKQLAEYTTFARNTVQNLNQHIRDRTGAVMNAAEIPRMMAEVPNLGDGIFDGDSATQFQSKTEGLLKSYDAAEARLAYVVANGLTPDKAERMPDGTWKEVSSSGLPLDDFKDLPSPPKNVNTSLWNKMSPADRREYVSLLNAKGGL